MRGLCATLVVMIALGLPAAAAADRFLITPGAGIGDVRLGTHISDVIRALGDPGALPAWMMAPDPTIPRIAGAIIYQWGDGRDLQVDGLGRVYVVGILKNARYVTPSGLHTWSDGGPDGSSRTDIVRALGDASRVLEFETSPGKTDLVYDGEGIALRISTDAGAHQDQVYKINVFAPVR